MAPCFGTFSIVASDPEAGEVGVAVASKFLAVGAVVPWAHSTVGAVATQAFANTKYGPEGIELLGQGVDPADVIGRLTQHDLDRSQRQLGIVAADGRSSTYTGEGCISWAGGTAGNAYAIQGNILTGSEVIEAMEQSFTSSGGLLGDRLLSALRAGDRAGGDRRGRESAALLVVREQGGYAGLNDRYIDLRVDDHHDPIGELVRIRALHSLYFDPSRPDEILTISREIVGELQRILHGSGDLEEPIGPDYDVSTQEALKRLFSRENLEQRWRDDASIDRIALEYLRDRFGPEGAPASNRLQQSRPAGG